MPSIMVPGIPAESTDQGHPEAAQDIKQDNASKNASSRLALLRQLMTD